MKKARKLAIYTVALFILGLSIALLQQNSFGLAPWDALLKNFHEGLQINYWILSPVLSVILIS
ncbi:MAG TPA: hypothetical protein VJ878_01225, partial [Candidatus Izemoplasmatales bacterium]|nr:hypothetical protein [Candidatus Izemoplasmatales bacterium]